MAATTKTKTIPQLLKDKRAGGSKAPIYRQLGVSPQTYDGWERNFRTPDDEYVERLAHYLDIPETDLALMAYRERLDRAKGLSRNRILGGVRQPVPSLAA